MTVDELVPGSTEPDLTASTKIENDYPNNTNGVV
jgi:hypothetical protein